MVLLSAIRQRWQNSGGDTKELAVASLLAFVVRALGAVSGFIATFVIARTLGAEESGYYFLAFSVVVILSAFGCVGLDHALLKHTGATPGAAISVLRRSLTIAFIASGSVALVLAASAEYFATAWFAKPALAPVLQAVSLGVVGLSLLTLVAMSLQGLRRVVSSIIILSIAVNLLLVVSLALTAVNSSVQLAWVFSFSTLAVFALGLVFLALGKKPARREVISYSAIWYSCAPLWIVVVMNQALSWGGQFVAGAYAPSEEVALLAVAQRTANLVTFVLIAVNLVVAPRFAAYYKQQDYDQLQRVATLSVKLMAAFASPVILVLLIVPGSVMSLFGADFTEGGYLLRILAVGQFINVVTGSVGYLLMMSGHERDLRNITLVVGPLSLVLVVVLTSYYGVLGAAIGTAIGISFQNLAAVWAVNRRLGFNTLAIWRS